MKTEDLKAIGLNDEQVQRVFAMNGEDVNRLKQTAQTLTAERDAARAQLDDANKKLEGYDPDWKQKAAEAGRKASEQVEALQRGYAAERAASGEKFSSESAKRAFVTELKAKNLPVQDGRLLGYDDFLAAYKKEDPNAFAGTGYPSVPDGGDPRSRPSGSTREQFADWFDQVMK